MARGVVRFVERQRQVYIHDFIVYVCGVDVSRYVKSVDITYTDRNSPGSADISLTNPMDQWVLTDQNFRGNWRLSEGKYSEKQKFEIFLKKRELSIRTVQIRNDPNRNNPENRNPLPPLDIRTNQGRLHNLTEAESQDFMQRYTFGPGSSVFSRFDTVKIFIKNPTDPEDMDRWIPAFTGTVEGKPFTTNFVDGSSGIQLTCYDVRNVLQGMRIAVNPVTNTNFSINQAVARTQQAVIDQWDAGFFKDIYPSNIRDFKYDNVFAGLSFTDSVSLMLTGQTNWINGTPTPGFPGAAFGYFNPGEIYRYAHPNNKSAQSSKKGKLVRDLEEWDNLCLFGIKGDFWTELECRQHGRNSFWTSSLTNSTSSSTPMNGFVHWLLPADGLNITNTVTQSVAGLNNVTGPLDWTDRYSLLTNFLKKIDYEVTVSGAGDFILEFPLYDFYPENFGSNSTFYIFDKHVKDESISDEAGDIVTALEVTTTSVDMAANQKDQSYNNPNINQVAIGQRAVVVSPIMASKYGTRVQAMTLTGIAKEGLKRFATYEFQKLLADINKTSFNATYRPYLRPNRPIMHKTRNRIGKSTTIRYNFPTLRNVTMSIGMHCVRTPIYRNGQISYMHVTGGAAMALSYNEVLENPNGAVANNNSGILVIFDPNPQTSNQ